MTLLITQLRLTVVRELSAIQADQYRKKLPWNCTCSACFDSMEIAITLEQLILSAYGKPTVKELYGWENC